MGLLTDFIETKLARYVEPTRAGTPPGEPVGFSRRKYHAVLLSLTSLPVEKAAKKVGVSYGLLRKWRTEGPFQQAVREHAHEFAADIVAYAFRAAKQKAGWWKQFYENELAEIATHPPVRFHYEGFNDAKLYGATVIEALLYIEKLLRPSAGTDEVEAWLELQHILYDVIVRELLGEDIRGPSKMKALRGTQRGLLHLAFKWLQAPDFSEGTKKRIAHVLRMLELSLEEQV